MQGKQVFVALKGKRGMGIQGKWTLVLFLEPPVSVFFTFEVLPCWRESFCWVCPSFWRETTRMCPDLFYTMYQHQDPGFPARMALSLLIGSALVSSQLLSSSLAIFPTSVSVCRKKVMLVSEEKVIVIAQEIRILKMLGMSLEDSNKNINY